MASGLLILVRGKDVLLTSETINKTRLSFYENAIACIEEALSGEVSVNNIIDYIKWKKKQSFEALQSKAPYSFTFIQRAYYIQSGECIPLLN